jgi:hypothetical protein
MAIYKCVGFAGSVTRLCGVNEANWNAGAVGSSSGVRSQTLKLWTVG